MKCPHCTDVTLLMSERRGVEIDYCPQCRGVWLDRGELDKLVELSVEPQVASPAYPSGQNRSPRQPEFVDSDFNHRSGQGYRKPRSWLSDIFD